MKFIPTGSELEVRAFLEALHTGSEAVVQDSTMVRVRIVPQVWDKAERIKLTCTVAYHKNANKGLGSVNVSGAATIRETGMRTLMECEKIYVAILKDPQNPQTITPFPNGTQELQKRLRIPAWSEYLKAKAEKEGKPGNAEPVSQARVYPRDPAYAKAIVQVVNGTITALEQFPTWRDKLLRFMREEMGASAEAMGTLAEEWDMAEDDLQPTPTLPVATGAQPTPVEQLTRNLSHA